MQKRFFLFFVLAFLSVDFVYASSCESGGGNCLDIPDLATFDFQSAAESGDALAMKNLGTTYLYGRGVEQSDQRAAYWYKMAADNGEVQAQYQIGLMLIEGKAVPRDFEQACHYIHSSSSQGYVPARLFLQQSLNFNDDSLSGDWINCKFQVTENNSKNKSSCFESVDREGDVFKAVFTVRDFDNSVEVKSDQVVLKKAPLFEDEKIVIADKFTGKKEEVQAFRLQIAAYLSQSHALRGWKILSGKYPVLLKYPHKISYEETGKGMYYRLSVLGDQKKLKSLCLDLKSTGQDCIIRSVK